ncbi:MAG: CBS domain-containing protein [Myxococcales bacterium]|nr:CBS domain-containing protein [Myxococcales bacterium]
MHNSKLLTARDIMTPPGIVVGPEMSVFTAIPILIKNNLTGCPVTNSDGELIGILSELDCMKVIASDAFYSDEYSSSDILVSRYMTSECLTITADMDIFRIANIFFEHTLRRIPVLEEQRLIGQITRSDVLKGIQLMRKNMGRSKEYGAFAWPTSTIAS